MRLRTGDTKEFTLLRGVPGIDTDGDKKTVSYTPDGTFRGCIQPYTDDRGIKEYGLDPLYAFVVYTADKLEFKETDMISCGGLDYRVRLIQPWGSHQRIIVERLRP